MEFTKNLDYVIENLEKDGFDFGFGNFIGNIWAEKDGRIVEVKTKNNTAYCYDKQTDTLYYNDLIIKDFKKGE